MEIDIPSVILGFVIGIVCNRADTVNIGIVIALGSLWGLTYYLLDPLNN